MEGLEKRKSLRLTLPGATVTLSSGDEIKVCNISLEGINLQIQAPLNSKIQGKLNLSGKTVGLIDILVVNHQGDSSGGLITNAADLRDVLTSWFNPKELIANLLPSDITDNYLTYEDQHHKCQFKFEFNHAKKINKVEILIFENMVLWNNTGWGTGKDSVVDKQPDTQKIELAKNMIKESSVFPQSFKDWLLELN